MIGVVGHDQVRQELLRQDVIAIESSQKAKLSLTHLTTIAILSLRVSFSLNMKGLLGKISMSQSHLSHLTFHSFLPHWIALNEKACGVQSQPDASDIEDQVISFAHTNQEEEAAPSKT